MIEKFLFIKDCLKIASYEISRELSLLTIWSYLVKNSYNMINEMLLN